MKRVAVFGNTGAGKSTLARRLSELLFTHAWWLTKRLFKGLWVTPESAAEFGGFVQAVAKEVT